MLKQSNTLNVTSYKIGSNTHEISLDFSIPHCLSYRIVPFDKQSNLIISSKLKLITFRGVPLLNPIPIKRTMIFNLKLLRKLGLTFDNSLVSGGILAEAILFFWAGLYPKAIFWVTFLTCWLVYLGYSLEMNHSVLL